jgi:SHS2 domain-containing protein
MSRPHYRITPTTADIGIEVWGRGLPELFTHAAQAILDIIADTAAVGKDITLDLEVEGWDIEALMVNWLNEIVFLHEAREMLFAEVQVLQITDLSVRGKLQGEAIDLKRHRLGRLIKGITYHRLSVCQVGEHEWRLQAILDI